MQTIFKAWKEKTEILSLGLSFLLLLAFQPLFNNSFRQFSVITRKTKQLYLLIDFYKVSYPLIGHELQTKIGEIQIFWLLRYQLQTFLSNPTVKITATRQLVPFDKLLLATGGRATVSVIYKILLQNIVGFPNVIKEQWELDLGQ